MNKGVQPEEVRAALDRLARSKDWIQSPRLIQFLQFVVEESLAGRGEKLKETVIGIGVFGRSPDYDPKLDPIVRVEARRLRLKLLEYYEGPGADDAVQFELPKGAYRPEFICKEQPASPADSPAPATNAAVLPPRPRPLVLWAALLCAPLFGAGWFLLRPAVPDMRTVAATPPRQLTTQGGYSRSPAFSPDGNQIAFSTESSDFHSHINIVPASGGAAKAITAGDVADYFPAWSPDGGQVAFLRRRDRRYELRFAATETGKPASERVLAEVSQQSPIEWTPDGQSILVSDAADPADPPCIVSVSVSTGAKRPVSANAGCSKSASLGDTQPHVSPDGRSLAFLRAKEAEAADIVIMPLDGKGEARTVNSSLGRINGFAWHPDGRSLLGSMARPSETGSIWRIPLDGAPAARLTEAGINPVFPAVARAGHRLAFVVRVSDTNVWRARITPGGTTEAEQLTRSLALDTSPQFSPDGRYIAWRSGRSGFDEIWVADSDGRNARPLTDLRANTTGSPRWSPDGARIAFESRKGGNPDIYVVPASGGAAIALTHDAAGDAVPSWSRDGRTIYFASNRTGQWQVWRMDAATGANQRQVTRTGGFAAFETKDGQALIYCLSPEQGGLRRVPTSGGAEIPVTDAVAPNFWGNWALGTRGVYYSTYGEIGSRAIRFLDLTSGQTSEVMPLRRLPVQWDSGLTISADEKWVAWSQLDQGSSDIYVLDNFR